MKTRKANTKTSLAIPHELWTRFRMQALAEHRPAHKIVAELLTAYLAKKGAK
jgi:hypothetical protein